MYLKKKYIYKHNGFTLIPIPGGDRNSSETIVSQPNRRIPKPVENQPNIPGLWHGSLASFGRSKDTAWKLLEFQNHFPHQFGRASNPTYFLIFDTYLCDQPCNNGFLKNLWCFCVDVSIFWGRRFLEEHGELQTKT